MGKYTALIRDPRRRVEDKTKGNILNVNINNIHSNTKIGVDKPIAGEVKHTLKGSEDPKPVTRGVEAEEEQNALTLYAINAVNPPAVEANAINPPKTEVHASDLAETEDNAVNAINPPRPAYPSKVKGVYVHRGDCPCEWCHCAEDTASARRGAA